MFTVKHRLERYFLTVLTVMSMLVSTASADDSVDKAELEMLRKTVARQSQQLAAKDALIAQKEKQAVEEHERNQVLQERIDLMGKRALELQQQNEDTWAKAALIRNELDAIRAKEMQQRDLKNTDTYEVNGQKPTDVLPAGWDLAVCNVSFTAEDNGVKCMGEIKNTRDRLIGHMGFTITIYNEEGKLVGTENFSVDNIPTDEKSPFKETIRGVKLESCSRFKIRVDRDDVLRELKRKSERRGVE